MDQKDTDLRGSGAGNGREVNPGPLFFIIHKAGCLFENARPVTASGCSCPAPGRCGFVQAQPGLSGKMKKNRRKTVFLNRKNLDECKNREMRLRTKTLCSFHKSGTETGSTYIHFPGSTVNFNPDGFHVCLPNGIGPSMGMAYIVSKMSGFLTDCTFCHGSRTSLLSDYRSVKPTTEIS